MVPPGALPLTLGSCSWVNARRVSFDKTSFVFFFMVLDLHWAATIVIDRAVIREIEIREEKTTGSFKTLASTFGTSPLVRWVQKWNGDVPPQLPKPLISLVCNTLPK